MLPFTSFTTMHTTHDSSLWRAFAFVDIVESIQEVWVISKYSRLPITRTLADSNQNRFPLGFPHTFTVIIPSVTRTLDNSILPQTRSYFCFPSDHFYIMLPSITQTTFWAPKKAGKNSDGVRNIDFDFPTEVAYSLLVEADVVSVKQHSS